MTDPRRDGVAGNFSTHYRPEIERAFPDEIDFNWIMRNSYIEFTTDGGHDMLLLRNPQTKRGILDQMGLPLPVQQRSPLVSVFIYSTNDIVQFDESKLKRLLSAELGDNVRKSDISIKQARDNRRRASLTSISHDLRESELHDPDRETSPR